VPGTERIRVKITVYQQVNGLAMGPPKNLDLFFFFSQKGSKVCSDVDVGTGGGSARGHTPVSLPEWPSPLITQF
jgi:hypothetical protein